MQLEIKKYTFFIAFQTALMRIWPMMLRRPLALPPSNLYRTLSQLPMDNFLACLCDEDYQSIIITGTASPDELTEVWYYLLYEYYDLKGDVVLSEEYQLSKQITRIQNHLFLLQQCIDFLYGRYSESIAKSLNKLGYSFRPKSKWPPDYQQDLRDIDAMSRSKYIQLKQAIIQRDDLRAKNKKNRPTRDYFEQLIIQIEELQRCTYDLEKLSAAKFILLEKKYWKHIDFLEARKNK